MQQRPLRPADKVEITVLVDNFTDLLLEDGQTVRRMRTQLPDVPLAEHGLSYLITVYAADEKHTILMDAGVSGACLLHNAGLLPDSLWARNGVIGHRAEDVQSIVLSHGHFDHFGGLPAFLAHFNKSVPLVVHPAVFIKRRRKMGPDRFIDMPMLTEKMLTDAGGLIDPRETASRIAGGLILVSGRIERQTAFEKGSPVMEAFVKDQWRIDPFEDDQSIAVHLKGKGLVIIGGCCHAGIINTVRHFCQFLGSDQVHMVMGGFHLSGAPRELIDQTVTAMQDLAPDMIVPMHCTGWQAMKAFNDAMPEQFVLNSAGTTYLLTS